MKAIRGKRVMVAEDEALVAEMLTSMLEDSGCIVVGPAFTFDEALSLAETETGLDLAVLDINLGGRSVDAVAVVLRKKAVPLIFATGYGAEADGTARDAVVIAKPYTQDRLELALESALSAR